MRIVGFSRPVLAECRVWANFGVHWLAIDLMPLVADQFGLPLPTSGGAPLILRLLALNIWQDALGFD